MPLILNIDTATEIATISIAKGDNVIDSLINKDQKEHASFLQPAIKQLLRQTGYTFEQLNAVCVTAGPGSYTGLRVGMASAKGICYGLKIPLITLSTLEVMTTSIIIKTDEPAAYLYCPMIDAGRMEVFTALFDMELNLIVAAGALILQPDSFKDYLKERKIIFCGNGANKFLNQSHHSNLIFKNIGDTSSAMAMLSSDKFQQKKFTDLSHSEPEYLKQFYTVNKIN